ncbi:MAG: zinc-ribbon domain-containing protein [Candidatus Lokiarchaeota archaeon]|nr:zinc-ribbon domain-containing protein [Candidatus Lokiarchaeota archaeon]MBD3341408.1 zinc-ribbon domain-containing protein [Candidatus Lokiarchaeota archaeon]
MRKFCSNCGEKVDPSWNVCPSCGETLKDEEEVEYRPRPTPQPTPQGIQQPVPRPVPQPYTQSYRKSTGNTNGMLSIIFGIIGLCCCAIVLGPLAIYFGNKGTKTDDNPSLGQIGMVLGIIDIVCCCILYFVAFTLLY